MSITIRSVISDGYGGINVEFSDAVKAENMDLSAVTVLAANPTAAAQMSSSTVNFRAAAWGSSIANQPYTLGAGLYAGFAGDAGTVDPLILSIKERIERLLVEIVQKADGVGTVYRWDGRGLRDPDTGLATDAEGQRISLKNGDLMVIAHDERSAEGGQGSVGTTLKTAKIEVQACIVISEDFPVPESFIVNNWLQQIEQLVMENSELTELGPSGERLAIETTTTATYSPPREIGQREAIAGVEFEVQYSHNRDDPAAGPGVTHKEI